MPTEELILVDLESKSIIGMDDSVILPVGPKKTLVSNLNRIAKNCKYAVI